MNNDFSNFNQNNQLTSNNVNFTNNQPIQKKSKINPLAIIGRITVSIIVLGATIFFLTSGTSNKLICKSDEGNITIMYNDSTIKGYAAVNLTYDIDGQRSIANEIGIDEYISQFAT